MDVWILAMLRGGTAALRIETGRWNGLKWEERICGQCTMGEIEEEKHFCCEDLMHAGERLRSSS